MLDTRFLFVVGGVCSSLGKGISAASIAKLLASGGFRVAIMKLDPYLNVDPGTMNPFQHGEVFVLRDGSETDLDLGHYERFTNITLDGSCSVSAGEIYAEVLAEERQGEHLGGTIQVVPHITNKIQEKIEAVAAQYQADFMIVEVGGTVGDIEGEPFMEAIRIMKRQYRDQVKIAMLTLVPYLAGAKELKSKPTQLAIRELQRRGIYPHIILARSDMPLTDDIIKKIGYFAGIPDTQVIPCPTVESIYAVPIHYHHQGVGRVLCQLYDIPVPEFAMEEWEQGYALYKQSTKEVVIGIAGKYTNLDDAYLSITEAIKAAGYHEGCIPIIQWINTEFLEPQATTEEQITEWTRVQQCDGIVVAPGFGVRGTEGKIALARYCREQQVPYLGICLGAQIMAIEFARSVLQIEDATSEEFDTKAISQNHIVHFIPEQRTITKKGATMRLGDYECVLTKGTRAYVLYNTDYIIERHRHRYEINTTYTDTMAQHGCIISGWSPNKTLPEIIELVDHPFMIGAQFHPEFLSRPFSPRPLFTGFVQAVV